MIIGIILMATGAGAIVGIPLALLGKLIGRLGKSLYYSKVASRTQIEPRNQAEASTPDKAVNSEGEANGCFIPLIILLFIMVIIMLVVIIKSLAN